MKTFTKKEIIILVIGIILISSLVWAGIRMIKIGPQIEETKEEAEKIEPLEEQVGVIPPEGARAIPPLVEERIYFTGEIKEVNSKENYLIVIPTWVDIFWQDKIQVNKELKIEIIPEKTSLTRVPLAKPGLEEPKEPIKIKIDDLKVGEIIHIEGKWNSEKNILEPLFIVGSY